MHFHGTSSFKKEWNNSNREKVEPPITVINRWVPARLVMKSLRLSSLTCFLLESVTSQPQSHAATGRWACFTNLFISRQPLYLFGIFLIFIYSLIEIGCSTSMPSKVNFFLLIGIGKGHRYHCFSYVA